MRASTFDVDAVSLSAPAFFQRLRASLHEGARVMTFYGRPAEEKGELALTAVLDVSGRLAALRAQVPRAAGFDSLTCDFPALHIFEREIFEQLGLEPRGHPWLKPVRFSGELQGKMLEYPFYAVAGKEVHEVGVGPIHAGVIEPGHFRFMCLGETVQHLEIQLGFQHRGVEALLSSRPHGSLAPLVESIAGDSSVAHVWAYCSALEHSSGGGPPAAVHLARGVALELERVAMHLAGLSGLCADIAFLPGAATYGRLRTTAINTSMLLCGSRFGKGWLRPWGSRAKMTAEARTTVRENIALIGRDIAIMNEHFLGARTVRHRLCGVGTLTHEQVSSMGLVGMTARASGVALDARCNESSGAPYQALKVDLVTEQFGDCWARAVIRVREIDASLRWLGAALDACTTLEPARAEARPLRPNALSVSVCEGWRGEVVHCLESNAGGTLQHYRVQDPSLRNWFGLALAVRDNEISDFPICNKSFDLSYCGHDL